MKKHTLSRRLYKQENGIRFDLDLNMQDYKGGKNINFMKLKFLLELCRNTGYLIIMFPLDLIERNAILCNCFYNIQTKVNTQTNVFFSTFYSLNPVYLHFLIPLL